MGRAGEKRLPRTTLTGGTTPRGKVRILARDFVQPTGIAVDGRYVFVADSQANTISRIDLQGGARESWGGTGRREGQFRMPLGLACREGKVYVADHDNDRVQIFTLDGLFVRQWGTSGGEAGHLSHPDVLAVSATVAYVAEDENRRVQALSHDGRFIATLPDPIGGFGDPTGIALRSDGGIYVADYVRAVVHSYSPSLRYLGSWGAHGSESGQFNGLCSAVVQDGTIYLCDQGNRRVQAAAADGKHLGTWLGAGIHPWSLGHPWGIAADSERTLYVTDVTRGAAYAIDRSAIVAQEAQA